jgi:hypothetical protein
LLILRWPLAGIGAFKIHLFAERTVSAHYEL